MINAVIIDDEINGAEALQLLIKQYCKQINITAIEHSAEKGIEAIINLKPHLVFLDIEMPTATGFDVINATKHIKYEVVFTTAYEHYAIKAFKTQAVDYLLKPIDADELITAIKNVEVKLQKNVNIDNSLELESLLKKVVASDKKVSIPTNEGIILLPSNDIIYLQSISNYTNMFLKNDQKLLVAKTLKSLEDQLKDYHFIRVHNTYIVNVNEIVKYIKGDGGTIILRNNSSIPVSRAHKQTLLDVLGLSI